MKRVVQLCMVLAVGVAVVFAQSQVKKDTIPGITNFAQIEATVACAGAATPASLAEIKKMGYKAVFNLRLPTEQGADIDGEAAADPTVVDNFLKAITTLGNQPAFIHCASGNRAAAMWFIKRAVIDKWDNDRALAEASELGTISQPMKTFALSYIDSHKK